MNDRAPQRPSLDIGHWTLVIPALGLALLLALTLPPLSATRMQTWPWAAGAALFWLLPLAVASVRLALGRPDSRLGGLLDAAFALLALAGAAATAFSPLRAALAPHLLPFLGALALPYALLPLLRQPRTDALSAAFLFPLVFVTAWLWHAAPPNLNAPQFRNDQPFGHANTTGSVFALGACWLAFLAWRADFRPKRLLFAGGALLCTVHLVSSGSRGSLLALAGAVAVAAGIALLRRGRVLVFLAALLALFSVVLLASPRLREALTQGGQSRANQSSNRERVAMLRGGLALARERPFSGWGPGAVPHVFPRVRAALAGEPDNYLQLHNTPVQLAATLGAPGLAAAALLLLALARRLRSCLNAPELVPLAATLACGLLILLFDHPFATPAFAVLAALPIAALVLSGPSVRPVAPGPWSLVLPAALAAGLAIPVGRDLAARAAWSAALDAATADDPAPYVAALHRAHTLVPADPFYPAQLTSYFAAGHPFPGLRPPDPAAAIPLLRETLARNPDNEFAHYNLGWLLLAAKPTDAAGARDHFAAAARLAPPRAGVYRGIALARLAAGGSDPAPLASLLAAEILLEPAFAWSPHWRESALAPYREAALARAASFLDAHGLHPAFAARLREAGPPAPLSAAYRRVRSGYGVLLGHPDGPPPADAAIFLATRLPPLLRDSLPSKGTVVPAPLLLECAGLGEEKGKRE